MAKVHLSSTILDLEAERGAVLCWLISANHQPVHSYVSESQTVHASCPADIDGCDLFVLILGHRYGIEPDVDSLEKLSIIHLEFRHAGELAYPLRFAVPHPAAYPYQHGNELLGQQFPLVNRWSTQRPRLQPE